jgi:glycosyl hydrolase family 38
LGHRVGLTRVGRGENAGPKRWVDRPDDPDRARAELVAGTCGVDAAAGEVRMRVGGLPLLRRGEDGTRRQAVRAVIDWPHAPATVTISLRCDGALAEQRDVALATGRNRVLLLAPDNRRTRAAAVTLSENRTELLSASFGLAPEREWTVYLVHHSHLDIGYTDAQGTVMRNHRSYLDQVLDLSAATAGWPDDARFRWNIEAHWPLQDWIRLRPAATADAFFDLVRAGLVEVTALPFNFHTEACSIDELAHTLRFADGLRARYGIDITTAMQTDVPGATIGLPQLLLDAGVRFLSVSHNYAGRSVPHHVGGQDLTRPFYWQTPAGERLLTWFGDTPHGMAYMEGTMLGLIDGYEQALELLPEYLAALAHQPYPYAGALSEWWRVPSGQVLTKQPYPHDILHLRVQGAYSDNAGPSIAASEVVRRWNEEWEYPHLRMATNADFFHAAQERLGDRLDTFTGDWTDWWADGLGSAARFVGMGRRAQAAVRSVQTLHAISGGLGAPAGEDVAGGVDAVSRDLALFDEHTWGAAEPWEDTLEGWWSGPRQWQIKSGYAVRASDRSGELIESGMERLVSRVASRDGDQAVIVVVNPTMHTRTDLVHTFVPASRFAPGQGFAVVDLERGERVPSQAGTPDRDRDRRRARGRDLTFLATGVPSFGYRVFALADLPDPAGPDPAPLGRAGAAPGGDPATLLRNEAYEVRYDLAEGCIGSLLDRRTGRELTAAGSVFGFGQYVYDRFTTAPRFNHLSSKIESRLLELLGERAAARHAALIERTSNALWERLTVRLAAPGTAWLDVTVTLPHGIDRVDLEYRLSKPDEEEKESAYLAFPFQAAPSGLRAEITGGVYQPGAPRVPGSAEHMRAIRHWVRLAEPATSISWATLEAPLTQVGNIHLPYAPFPVTLEDEPASQTTIYSWLFNNVWDTNFPASQAGEMTFRYAISASDPAAGDAPARAMAAALTTPLLASVRAGLLPDEPPAGSFCLAEGDVEVLALRQRRGGAGLSVLVHSPSAAPETVTLRFPGLRVRRASVGDHLDRVLAPAEVTGTGVRATLRPGALSTVLIDTGTGTVGGTGIDSGGR